MKLKNHDYIITIGAILLATLSLLLIYSTTFQSTTPETGAGTLAKQIIFFIAGFIIYFLISTIKISWMKSLKLMLSIYFLTIGSLVYVKIFGEDIANTNRWITILGFSIQPAEYAKLSLVLVTAALFGVKKEVLGNIVSWKENQQRSKFKNFLIRLNNRRPQLLPTIISATLALPVILLIFIQPAFGNSIIISIIWLCVLFAASFNQLKLINFTLPVLLLSLFSWEVLNIGYGVQVLSTNISSSELLVVILASMLCALLSRIKIFWVMIAILIGFSIQPFIQTIWESDIISPYQKERVEVFFNSPEDDPLDAGYQVKQSKIAIGSGRVWGRGYLQGTQSALQVLPFAHTDFIFASLAEQFGMLGSIILLGIYSAILYRIVKIAIDSNDEFSFLVGIGIAITLVLSIFINIGMNMGQLPVTGIPLPLLSYGGSSVLVTLIGLGIVQSIKQDAKIKDVSESFNPSNSPWR